jgi:hypothetical protein
MFFLNFTLLVQIAISEVSITPLKSLRPWDEKFEMDVNHFNRFFVEFQLSQWYHWNVTFDCPCHFGVFMTPWKLVNWYKWHRWNYFDNEKKNFIQMSTTIKHFFSNFSGVNDTTEMLLLTVIAISAVSMTPRKSSQRYRSHYCNKHEYEMKNFKRISTTITTFGKISQCQ